VPDGDVESDPTAFWYAIADGGNYSWDTVAHSGAHSLKIVSTVTGQTRWMSQGRIPATAGTTYTASAYVTATGSPATIAVVFWDAQGHALGTIESSGATSSSWTQVSVRGGAPAGTAYARVELRLHGAGTLRADDVALAAS
jgi:hypothetical protein